MPSAIVETAESIRWQFLAEEYPRLSEVSIEHLLQRGYDCAHEFEFGLDLILDSLDTRHDAG